MRRHIKRVHGQAAVLGVTQKVVRMQTWFPNVRGGYGIWWTVQKRPSPLGPRPLRPAPVAAEPLAPLADLYAEPSLAGTAFKGDQNQYVAETGWESTFRRRPFWHALRQASYLPSKAAVPLQLTDPRDLDGNLASAYFTSKEEAVLGTILRTQGRLIQRCKATFDTTPKPFLNWLLSEHQGQRYHRAFAWLSNPGTLNHYVACWKRLLCCLFRTTRLDDTVERRVLGISSLLTAEQRQLLVKLWRYGEVISEQEALASGDQHIILSTVGLALEEGLLKLAVSLLTTKMTDIWSKSYRSLLVYVTGILSLNLTDGSPQNPHFVPISDSTSILSGLIWVSRVLFLEYALPQKPYNSQRWPDRSTYPEPLDRLCTIHTAYMTHESLTPLSELLRLRRIGRKYGGYDVGRCLLFWSCDDSVVTIKRQSISLPAFRAWVLAGLDSAASQMAALIGPWLSEPNLPPLGTLTELISNREPGMSFIILAENKARLEGHTQAFVRWSVGRLQTADGTWVKTRVNAYFGDHDQLLRSLLLCIYQTSGQPARGPEILSVKVCNTQNSPRNIVISHGRLCLITSYTKAGSGNSEPFYVIRFLPLQLSQLLYKYLVYIRPCIKYLSTELHRHQPQYPCYLWPKLGPKLGKIVTGDTWQGSLDIGADSEDDLEEDLSDNDQQIRRTSHVSALYYESLLCISAWGSLGLSIIIGVLKSIRARVLADSRPDQPSKGVISRSKALLYLHRGLIPAGRYRHREETRPLRGHGKTRVREGG
jgi:hypothetical protein